MVRTNWTGSYVPVNIAQHNYGVHSIASMYTTEWVICKRENFHKFHKSSSICENITLAFQLVLLLICDSS